MMDYNISFYAKNIYFRIESSEDLTDILIDDKGNWSYANIKQEKRA